jgi:hypothetical protein
MRPARAALTIALFGIALSPVVGIGYGSAAGVACSLAHAAVGFALCPEPRRG